MTAVVMSICPRERIWLDPSRIGSLYAELGGVEMQALLDRAMAEMGVVHDELSAQFAARDLQGFRRNLRRLGRISDHLGLTTMVRIVADVTACLERGDSTALAATWARLSRSTDQARHGTWRGG